MKTYKKVWGLVMISFVGCQIMAQSTQLMLPKKQARSGRTSGQFGHKGEVLATQTIADIILATPDLTTFAGLLRKHNLLSMLQGNAQFTVFAPTNEAFNEDVMYTLNNLIDSEVANILKHHIVKGAYTAKAIPDEVQTVANDTLYTGSGYVVINNKKEKVDFDFAKADITTKNGIVHIINSVLIPFQSFK